MRKITVAVEQQTRPHHIQIGLRIAGGGAGIGAVAQGDTAAQSGFHRVDYLTKQGKLPLRVANAFLVRLIGHRKVRENTLHGKTRQMAGGANIVHIIVKVFLIAQIAQTGHTGIHLDVHRQRAAVPRRFPAVLQRLCLAGHRLGDMVINQLAHLFFGRMAQDQDGHINGVVAQLHGLINTGHGQIIGARLLQYAGNLYGAVSVSVGLHHTQEFGTGRQAAQRCIVVRQGVQINLCPGSSQRRFHILCLLPCHRFFYAVPVFPCRLIRVFPPVRQTPQRNTSATPFRKRYPASNPTAGRRNAPYRTVLCPYRCRHKRRRRAHCGRPPSYA